jgi:hypothetical protein
MSKSSNTFNFKKISALEILVFVLFVIYLVFQIQTPSVLIPFISSPFGITIVLIITLLVFFFTNPILGVLSLFVAYEFIRRSMSVVGKVVTVKYTPTQMKKDMEMVAMNPPKVVTLEEDIVSKMAPYGMSEPIKMELSSFKPVAENINNASMV